MQSLKKRIRRANQNENSSSSEFEDDLTKQDIEAYQSKRAKVEQESALFQAYRSLGYYTSAVPMCIYKSSED
jgi:hypothetical protein